MGFYKLLSIVAFASVLLLDRPTKVDACSCLSPATLCDEIENADVVVHGTALSRTEEIGSISTFAETIYTISINTIYKGNPDMPNEQEIGVTTFSDSALCGVDLELDEEYLLGLFDDDGGGELSMHLCGLIQRWSFVSDEDKATLEAGCDIGDPCAGDCDEFQDCVQYQRNDKWYCSDTCDNNPCADDERCTTRAKRWCRRSGDAGCPESRRCH